MRFPGPTKEEARDPRRNSRIPPQLEENHVVPMSLQDEPLARYGVSREVPVSVLKCPVKVGNPLQTKQSKRPSYREQEGRRGSDKLVPGISVFTSSETDISGNFWGHIKDVKYRFALQDGTWDFS